MWNSSSQYLVGNGKMCESGLKLGHAVRKITAYGVCCREIYSAIEKLKGAHYSHLAYYDPKGGKDNERRLTGMHETASMAEVSL